MEALQDKVVGSKGFDPGGYQSPFGIGVGHQQEKRA